MLRCKFRYSVRLAKIPPKKREYTGLVSFSFSLDSLFASRLPCEEAVQDVVLSNQKHDML